MISVKVIKNSFIELLKENKYPDISIQNIADQANISRRTFYTYYENKEQLYEEIVGDFIEWSLCPFKKSNHDQLFSSKIEQFVHVIINQLDLLECLFDQDCPNILAAVIEKILMMQIQEDTNGFFLNKLSTPAIQHYYVETISQNCVSSINYILTNKHLSKAELIRSLCEACDQIAYFYKTDH